MTEWEKKINKIIEKTLFKVERTFEGIKRWFNGGLVRYRSLAKMHTQNLMEANYRKQSIEVLQWSYIFKYLNSNST